MHQGVCIGIGVNMVKVIKSSYEIEKIDGRQMLMRLARNGAVCYKHEDHIETLEDAMNFIRRRIQDGHESVIEHEKITVKVICDRGVTHEIVRHRLGSYSQESTRYCNYGDDRFGKEITVIDIKKHLGGTEEGAMAYYQLWEKHMEECERVYNEMVNVLGIKPQFARSILPNSLKTEIVVTYNLREWRHFFKLRAVNKRAHPQLREITIPMLEDFKRLISVVFDDLEVTDEI